MNSKFRLTKSSEEVNLDIGVPAIQRLSSDKHSDELRIYCELSVEAQRILRLSLEEEKLDTTTETLIVEPHYVNITCCPVTRELLAEEKKRKEQEKLDAVLPEPDVGRVKTEPSPPATPSPVSKAEIRRKGKNSDKKRDQVEKARRRSSIEKASAGSSTVTPPNMPPSWKFGNKAVAERKPPDIPAREKAAAVLPQVSRPPPPRLPALPTAPIPVSELPPAAIRSPPAKMVNNGPMIPALSNLTPIPLRELQQQAATTANSRQQLLTGAQQQQQQHEVDGAGGVGKPVAAAPAATEFISIQVPMAGIDGTQVMQTINVPKSVLIGASERPVLLTVTPKNGIHKGQKQIVVLTRNQGGIGAMAKSAAVLSSPPVAVAAATTSPTKVMLGPRPEAPLASPSASAGVVPRLPTSSSVTDINRLLAQVQPVSSTELQRQGMMPTPHQQPNSIGPNSSSSVLPQQRVIVSQGGGGVVQHLVQASSINSNNSPVQYVVQRPIMQQPQQANAVIGGGQPQQRIIQTVVRAGGAPLQQLVMQNGKPVLVSSVAAGQQQQQAPQGKIVLSHKGQLLQGAQLQKLAGQIINTTQGQFLIGPQGQLLPAQKLPVVQTTPNSPQTVRFVRMAQQPASPAPHRLPTQPATIVRLGVPNGSSPAVAEPPSPIGGYQQVVASGQAGGPITLRQVPLPNNPSVIGSMTGLSSPVSSGAATATAGAEPLNRILNALSNRGLLTQQNGKLYYVGGGDKSSSSVMVSGSGMPVSVGGAMVTTSAGGDHQPAAAHPIRTLASDAGTSGAATSRMVQVVVSSGAGLDSFTASPSLVKMASSFIQSSASGLEELMGASPPGGYSPYVNGSHSPAVTTITTSVSPVKADGSSNFAYRDPRLPAGWWVSVEVVGGQLRHGYHSPRGDRLRSPSEVAHYLQNKLILLPTSQNLPPPENLAELPALSQLSAQARALVPNIVLPQLAPNSPVIRQVDSEILTADGSSSHALLKRPLDTFEETSDAKKGKIMFY